MPDKVIEIIRHTHDGMCECVRMHYGECSKWFDVEQGLRQGCLLTQLLYHVFVAASKLALNRFSEDPVCFAQLVHLDELAAKR